MLSGILWSNFSKSFQSSSASALKRPSKLSNKIVRRKRMNSSFWRTHETAAVDWFSKLLEYPQTEIDKFPWQTSDWWSTYKIIMRQKHLTESVSHPDCDTDHFVDHVNDESMTSCHSFRSTRWLTPSIILIQDRTRSESVQHLMVY